MDRRVDWVQRLFHRDRYSKNGMSRILYRICVKKLSFEPTSNGRCMSIESPFRSTNVSIHGNKPQSITYMDTPDSHML